MAAKVVQAGGLGGGGRGQPGGAVPRASGFAGLPLGLRRQRFQELERTFERRESGQSERGQSLSPPSFLFAAWSPFPPLSLPWGRWGAPEGDDSYEEESPESREGGCGAADAGGCGAERKGEAAVKGKGGGAWQAG